MTHSPFDDLFRATERQYTIVPHMLKALAFVESSWNPRAYRFEPLYWERYLKNDSHWSGRDPQEVSASYGLCQLMYPTAVGIGFDGDTERLYNPAINIDLGGRYLRLLLDGVWRDKDAWYDFPISAMDVSLSRYNGGTVGNPRADGTLRNQSYVNKVLAQWEALKA